MSGLKFLAALIAAPFLLSSPAPAAAAWQAAAGGVTTMPHAYVAGGQAVRKLWLAQARDDGVRVNQLEEQIRQLNGRIEELTFQLLEMQEELRRMQEDNELRFQELESKRGISRPNTMAERAEPEPRAPAVETEPAEKQGDGIAGLLRDENLDADANAPLSDDADSSGLQPQTLGTLTFDETGNLVGSEIGEPIDLTGRARARNGIEEVRPAQPLDSSLSEIPEQLPDDPDQLYELGYGYVQRGDYELAEQVFGEYVTRYPESIRIAEARFWLGESLFAQGQYEEAARIFLDAHKKYPDSRMGAQTLLKLGVSLAGMNQRELACATYAEVPRKYPSMPNALKSKLDSEQRASSCQVN